MSSTHASSQAEATIAQAGEMVRVGIAGRLDADALPAIWKPVTDAASDSGPGGVEIDGTGLDYCDGAGLGLFAEVRRLAVTNGGELRFTGLSDDLLALVQSSQLNDAKASVLNPPKPPGSVTQIGQATAAIFDDIVAMICFVGELTRALLWAVTHPHKVRLADTLLVAQKLGADAVPVVCLLGFLMGLIIAFQSAGPMKQFGAESLIPTLVAFAIIPELGPLITAIILAGRSGSAFAAEIGTMKVTEELNALETFGLDPTRFLVVPRVLAALVMVPLLSLFATFMGVIGGYVVMASLGYSLAYYIEAVTAAAGVEDLLQGLIKAVIFAMLVAAVGCLRGLRTASGPGAVGESTTRAVVAGIVLVIAADGIMGVLFYYLRM